MIKMFCDRCGKPIEGTTYYDINIVAKDIEPANDYTTCADTYSYNAAQITSKAFNKEKHYCEECRNKIEEFIAKKEE